LQENFNILVPVSVITPVTYSLQTATRTDIPLLGMSYTCAHGYELYSVIYINKRFMLSKTHITSSSLSHQSHGRLVTEAVDDPGKFMWILKTDIRISKNKLNLI
jgi:hypothetical protein